MADWEIKKTLGQCFSTGQPFVVGQDYYAAIVETKQEVWTVADFLKRNSAGQ